MATKTKRKKEASATAQPAKSASWTATVTKRLATARALAKELAQPVDRYTPQKPLAEAAVARFEKANGISLPEDYRDFLLRVGASGAGPDYGLRPLAAFAPTAMPGIVVTVTSKNGKASASAGTGARPALARAAQMKRPFVLDGPYAPLGDDGRVVAPPVPADAHLYDGCLELAEIGCGYSYLLVVTGTRRGEVWVDYTAGDGSLAPIAPFRAWLDAWLDEDLAHLASRLAQRIENVERPKQAKAALAAAQASVEAAATRDARLLPCAGHVRHALGETKSAREILRTLEARHDDAAPGLRAAIFAKQIAEASSKGTPALAKHEAREVRLALAANAKLSAGLVAELAKDADVDVRALAARHPNAAPSLVAEIARDGLAAAARGEIGLHIAMTVELALRNDSATAALVDQAISAAEKSRDRLAAVILRGAALSPACTAAQRARLAGSSWPEVRHAVARSRSTSAELLKVLARDEDAAVRAAVAARRDLSEALLEQLAVDAETSVREAVAGNPRTPARCLVKLVLDTGHESAAHHNPAAPAALVAAFDLLVDNDDYDRMLDEGDVPEVRSWADEVDVDGISSIVPAADVVERQAVRHWSFPVAALPLFVDAHMGAYNMAGRPWLSAEMFALLSKDRYDYARSRIAERRDTPKEIVDRLAHDETALVRTAAASNPKLPLAMLVVLAADAEDSVREAAAANPNLPAEHLTRLAKDKNAYVRRGVVRSPKVTSALLAQLAADRSEDVRVWVPYARSVTRSILDGLTKDKYAQTRGRVAFRRAVEKLA